MQLIDLWEEYNQLAKLELRKSSYDSVEAKVRLHILPFFSHKQIESITTLDIRKWQGTLLEEGQSVGNINSITIVFARLFSYAVECDYLKKSIFIGLKKVKDSTRSKSFDNYWTYQEFIDFIQIVDDYDYFVFFNTLYFTGLRRGEIKALKWTDIDFKEGYLDINKQIVKVKGNAQLKTLPKTEKSIRKVYMNKSLNNLLFNYYVDKRQLVGFKEDWYIFGAECPFADTTIARKLQYYINLTKIKRITPHGFRHSHASLLINLGINILAIADRLGHDDVKQTLDRYSHLYPNALKETALAIDKYIINSKKDDDLVGLIERISLMIREYQVKHSYFSERELYILNRINAVLEEVQ